MPAPRLFVSSTCYDLQDVRHALRQFIMDFGFEPVMSEFGDIFYAYESHVQDACLDAIEKCNLFLLIVGNNYGSLYHNEKDTKNVPSSITLKEFSKALEVDIPKHIFINRFVEHDYRNFRRHFEEKLKEYFDEHDVKDDETQLAINRVRAEMDRDYPFPQPNYRFVFHFLDQINDLKVNNAVFTFEVFGDINEQLRRQWAGFMYEALSSSRSVSTRVVEEFTSRIDSLERILRQLVTSKKEDSSGQISLNIDVISQSLVPAELEQAQEILEESIREIFYGFDGERGYFTSDLNHKNVSIWLESLESVLKNYKWSKTVLFEEVVQGLGGQYSFFTKRDRDISTKQLMKLYGLYRNIPKSERESFSKSVLLKLRPLIRLDNKKYERPKPLETFEFEKDDLPF